MFSVFTLTAFMKSTKGNWRNATYLSGICPICDFDNNKICHDFLFAVSADGVPLFIPRAALALLTGECISTDECHAVLDINSIFITYKSWIDLHIESDTICPVKYLDYLRETNKYSESRKNLC